MTSFRKLKADTVEAVLSEYVHDGEEIVKGEVEHFIRLVEASPSLRYMLDVWSQTALQERRTEDLFSLAMWVGFQCGIAIEEKNRLEKLFK
jgi:hypothetical protein